MVEDGLVLFGVVDGGASTTICVCFLNNTKKNSLCCSLCNKLYHRDVEEDNENERLR